MFTPENQFQTFFQKPQPTYILSDRLRQTSKQRNCSNIYHYACFISLSQLQDPHYLWAYIYFSMSLNTHTHRGRKLQKVCKIKIMPYAISEHNFHMLLKLSSIPCYLCTTNSTVHVPMLPCNLLLPTPSTIYHTYKHSDSKHCL